jgi:hypothetical protein
MFGKNNHPIMWFASSLNENLCKRNGIAMDGPLPVLPVFPPPVRRRVVRDLTLGLQTAVRVTRTRPDHRRFLYGRSALRLSSLHLAPLSLRLDQLVPVPPVLVFLARRRLPAPVPVPSMRLARPSGLLALVVG